ncbi:MAG TPA: ABC transporter ATP-binding protein [Rubrobacter sp.]|nr:ABC transporter ATP-binding protein [Rubrobacter sp.]
MDPNEALLEVRGLKTHFFLDEGIVKAVDGVDLNIRRGETLCVVGESGCGKSVTARSILQLVDRPGRVVEGEILPPPPPNGEGKKNGAATDTRKVLDLASLDPRSKAMRDIRGKEISMIFQEPMTSLSPVHTIGDQIMENVLLHLPMNKQEARERAVEELGRVGIPNPERRLDAYPFQLSGGMRQRAMIAMALACNPSLLIADEPTTALDVTTQAQILELMRGLQEEMGMAIMFITHDLGVVAELADDVAVMYLGIVVERGDVDSIFHDPKHPYTQALLRSIPRMGRNTGQRLDSIRGMVPHPYNRPMGCPFHTRCDEFMEGYCERILPPTIPLEGTSPESPRETRCLIYGGKDEEGAKGEGEAE